MTSRTLGERMDAVEKRVDRIEAEGGRQLLPVAPDEVLDSPFGDKIIRRDPRDWKGRSYVGSRMSQCPPEYLDMTAALYQWMANRDQISGRLTAAGVPCAGLNRTDASIARGWARRIRAGWKPSAVDTTGQREVAADIAEIEQENRLDADPDDEIPF